MEDYKESCPPLPVEITVENGNNSIFYNQQIYKKGKQTWSSIKQGFTEEEQFKSYGYITGQKIGPLISHGVKCFNGGENVPPNYRKEIITAIMMNIEFLRTNKSIEQNIVMNISNSNNFQFQNTQYPGYSDRTIIGENCFGKLTELGVLRIGLYGYE